MRQQGETVAVYRWKGCFKVDKSTVGWGVVLSFVIEDCAHQGVNGIMSLKARLGKLVWRGSLGCPHMGNDTAE
jgi:hypothetical protein